MEFTVESSVATISKVKVEPEVGYAIHDQDGRPYLGIVTVGVRSKVFGISLSEAGIGRFPKVKTGCWRYEQVGNHYSLYSPEDQLAGLVFYRPEKEELVIALWRACTSGGMPM